MAQFGNSILDPKVVAAAHDRRGPVRPRLAEQRTSAGTEQGPYQLESWEPGNQWVLTAQPQLPRASQPKIERIIFKVIPDPSSRATAAVRAARSTSRTGCR